LLSIQTRHIIDNMYFRYLNMQYFQLTQFIKVILIKNIRGALSIGLFLLVCLVSAQEKELLVVGGKKELNNSGQLPTTITSERSVVLVYKTLWLKKGGSPIKANGSQLWKITKKAFVRLVLMLCMRFTLRT